jgi:hypothetical protein
MLTRRGSPSFFDSSVPHHRLQSVFQQPQLDAAINNNISTQNNAGRRRRPLPNRTRTGEYLLPCGEAAVACRRHSPYNGPPTFDLGLRKSTE